MIVAETGFAEATWILIVKSLLIFLGVFLIVPVLTVVERKMIGRFQHRYGPNRVGPRGDAAARRHHQAGRQAGLPPGRRGAVPVRDRPGAGDLLRDHDDRNLPFGDVKDGVGFYGIDVPIGVLYFFASARSRSTGC